MKNSEKLKECSKNNCIDCCGNITDFCKYDKFIKYFNKEIDTLDPAYKKTIYSKSFIEKNFDKIEFDEIERYYF